LGLHHVSVQAVSPFGGRSSKAGADANVYQPAISGDTFRVVPDSSIAISGTGAGPGDAIAIRDQASGSLLASGQADATGAFTVQVPLPVGTTQIVAVATRPSGDVSLPSAPVTIVSAPPPTAQLALTATVAGSQVTLNFNITGDTSHLRWLQVLRGPP